jgi:hypothetical protein
MTDETEGIRRVMVAGINGAVESNSEVTERARLEKEYGVGNVWDTSEISRDFKVIGFMAPFCVVERKSDGVKGSVEFQHSPRFYFNFEKDSR